MRVSFVLKKVLEAHNGCKRGAIKHIVDHTHLSRHVVSQLLNNQTKTISFEVLFAISEYLHKYFDMNQKELLGSLFELDANGFLSLLADSNVKVYVGLRSMSGQAENLWVNAHDAFLQNVFTQEFFSFGKDAKSNLDPRLVRSAHEDNGDDHVFKMIKKETLSIYNRFQNGCGNRALVCMGSIKSNPLCERLMASIFDANAFQPDNVDIPAKRKCPVYFAYRKNDPNIASCHGGLSLSSGHNTIQPGIHYETAGGEWKYLPSNEHQDAALILYAYHPNRRVTEMILAGFSGRSTGCIAKKFPELVDQIWTPHYTRENLKLGVFLVRFEFDGSSSEDPTGSRFIETPSSYEVIQMDEEVIQRRLNQPADEGILQAVPA